MYSPAEGDEAGIPRHYTVIGYGTGILPFVGGDNDFPDGGVGGGGEGIAHPGGGEELEVEEESMLDNDEEDGEGKEEDGEEKEEDGEEEEEDDGEEKEEDGEEKEEEKEEQEDDDDDTHVDADAVDHFQSVVPSGVGCEAVHDR